MWSFHIWHHLMSHHLIKQIQTGLLCEVLRNGGKGGPGKIILLGVGWTLLFEYNGLLHSWSIFCWSPKPNNWTFQFGDKCVFFPDDCQVSDEKDARIVNFPIWFGWKRTLEFKWWIYGWTKSLDLKNISKIHVPNYSHLKNYIWARFTPNGLLS